VTESFVLTPDPTNAAMDKFIHRETGKTKTKLKGMATPIGFNSELTAS